MNRDRGVVLINALVVVLVITSVAAALLARSEASRVRADLVRGTEQIGLHLDAMEDFVTIVLAPVGRDGGVVHPDQPWNTEPLGYEIGAGRVSGRLADLQGRLNVNWLAGAEDPYVDETFRLLFQEIDLSPALVGEIREFLAPGGPRDLPRYLRASPPAAPPGGPLRLLDELKILRSLQPGEFEVLSRHVAALPVTEQLNLNTAPLPVLRAALHPLPPEVRAEFTPPLRKDPIRSIAELRDMTIAILRTEDVDELPFRRFTVSSRFFLADLTAELDGDTAARRVRLHRTTMNGVEPIVTHRWALRD